MAIEKLYLTLASSLLLAAVSYATEAKTPQLIASNHSAANVSSQAIIAPVTDNPSFKEVGRGEMDWWWFSLYRAKLLTLDGDYTQGEYPLILDIEYYQEIPSARLVEATQDQWQHLGVDPQRQQQWLSAIDAIWPDVNEGDRLTLKILTPEHSQFYFNGKPLAQPLPLGFSEDFLAIWLSESTSRPELRKQLLGELACDC
ncbi:chalcone isomerase family protein [Shewanella sp. 125m-1]